MDTGIEAEKCLYEVLETEKEFIRSYENPLVGSSTKVIGTYSSYEDAEKRLKEKYNVFKYSGTCSCDDSTRTARCGCRSEYTEYHWSIRTIRTN